MNNQYQYLTPIEVGRQLRIHPVTIRRLAVAGKIPGAIKIGRAIRIPASYVRSAVIPSQAQEQKEAHWQGIKAAAEKMPPTKGAKTELSDLI